MVDHLSPEKRSWNMSRIPSADTGPEKAVRSLLHHMGYRFRLHHSGLPGKPDIVLPKYKTTVFVHGCFWHRHKGCKDATTPKSNTAFWEKKFNSNIKRDKKNQIELLNKGWKIIIIWECEILNSSKLSKRLQKEIYLDKK